MRRIAVALTLTVLVGIARTDGPAVKELPAELVAAWTNAGAQAGSMIAEEWRLRFPDSVEERKPALPAFKFVQWKAGVLKKLPPPQAPFGLELWGTDLADEDLREIAGLQTLRALSLSFTKVKGAGLKELARLKNLEALSLCGSPETGAGLRDLAGLKSLRALDLSHSNITDEGLKELGEMRSLHSLSIGWSQITDVGIKELAGLKNLQSLGLGYTKATSAGLKNLAPLKNLTTLDLSSSLKEADIVALGEIGLVHVLTIATGMNETRPRSEAEVSAIDLHDIAVTDAGLKTLAKLEGLQSLSLYSVKGTKVTDDGLKVLAGLKNLRSLEKEKGSGFFFGYEIRGKET